MNPLIYAIASSDVVQVDPLVLSFFTGSLVPLLTRVVTKSGASSSLKANVMLVLSILVGIAAAFVAAGDNGLTWLEVATAAITTYLSAGVTYARLWKPNDVTTKIGDATAGFGLGPAIPEP